MYLVRQFDTEIENIIGVDPGPDYWAWVQYSRNLRKPIAGDIISRPQNGATENETFSEYLKNFSEYDAFAIEVIQPFGMRVGRTVMQTAYAAGILTGLALRWNTPLIAGLTRTEVKYVLCHSMRAKDADIRQRLLDLIGPKGTKKNPGPLYRMRKDLWSALAVAVALDEAYLSERAKAYKLEKIDFTNFDMLL